MAGEVNGATVSRLMPSGRLGVLRAPFGIGHARRQEASVGHAWPSHAASVHAALGDPNGANRTDVLIQPLEVCYAFRNLLEGNC
jgi:hypothetical protein